MIEAFPLSWPISWPRTKHRKQAPYKVTLDVALEEMLHELRLWGARAIIVSSNVPLRRDGSMYRDRDHRVSDPGVAVYWDARDGSPREIACDTWQTVRENVRALGLSFAGLRLVDRCGATQISQRAFQGFARLPAGTERKPWWQVLGVGHEATGAAVAEAFRQLAKQHHPDRGGDARTMAELNHAYQEAMEQLR